MLNKSFSFIQETMANVQSHSTYNRTYERKVIEEGTKGSPITSTSILSGIPVMSAIPTSFHIQPHSLINNHQLNFGGINTSTLFSTSDNHLEVVLDISEYGADNIEISISNNYIVVKASHPEKEDQMGLISRSFTRKFPLPANVKPDAVESNVTGDGKLHIKAFAPKDQNKGETKSIPIKINN
uniref:SHSP domain-containing protein n=1 Tax=Strongyloides stercoralis TaxID=6248 RepID=A0A0K0E756_STRER